MKIVELGKHMPLSTRRVVLFCGKPASATTALGLIDGMADGAVLVRADVDDAGVELTPAEARDIASALTRAAAAIEAWQEHASGFNKIRVYRAGGLVEIMWRGRRRPMRLSKLKGDKRGRFWRRCDGCGGTPTELYVAADVVRDGGWRVNHVQVCPGCVDKLANLPEPVAELVEFKPKT